MRIGATVIIACILLVFCAGCVSNEPGSPPEATAEGLRTYVVSAAQYAREVEPATACAVFNDPQSPLISLADERLERAR